MYESLEVSEESSSPDSVEQVAYWDVPNSASRPKIVITDGWYRDGLEGRNFEVKVYLNEETGKYAILVPNYVRNLPEKWIRIDGE